MPWLAEMIPLEPDPANTGEGKSEKTSFQTYLFGTCVKNASTNQ